MQALLALSGLIVAFAFIYSLLRIAGGAPCVSCGMSDNSCQESRDVLKRRCCPQCSHAQHVSS